MALHAVIMAGGSGTRFWPASRALRPKQLLPLLGDSKGGGSLLSATVRRLTPLIPPERIVVVTAEKLADETRRELPDVPRENILCEPAPRNTAPCIGWATNVLLSRDPDAIVAVLPSDHHIANEDEFRRVVSRAVKAAEIRPIATIGIKPTRPDTGFGYIEVGEKIEGVEASDVVRFVEKPDLARAQEFVQSGRFLWNGGTFFFRARAMKEAIERHMPELAKGLAAMANDASATSSIFPTLPSISIDYGVIEKVTQEKGVKLAVVPGDFGWSDVGSWESAWELSSKDARGNAMPEGGIAVDAKGNLARATSGKIVALVGVDDLVVVETDDAILVMPRARAQDVRAVVDALKASGRIDRI